MAVTLLEAARVAYNENKERLSEIILQFAEANQLLQVLPFRDISGLTLEFPVEARLPNSAFRGINEGYTEDSGETKLVAESVAIGGGDVDIDLQLIPANDMQLRSQYERQKIQAFALNWVKTFVKGDRTTNPKEFNGLQTRFTGSTKQLIPAGSTSGGDALSLQKLDLARSRVRRPTHWIMPRAMCLRLTAAVRNTSIAGYITFTQDQFGQSQTVYAGLPVIEIDEDANGNAIMDFTESCPGGGSTGTSIYCASFGPMMLTGIQKGPMDARDLGEIQTKPVYRTRVEWAAGIAVIDPKSIARVYGIADAAIVL
jgi:hypothetical protein